MGHRALVAYERADGLYDLHYSHWGAVDFALAHGITSETPFGGDSGDSTDEPNLQTIRRQLAAGDEFETLGGHLVDDQPDTPIDPEPMDRALPLDKIPTDHLDYCQYEAFYVVTAAHEVTAYRVLCARLPHSESDVLGVGVLVAVHWQDEKQTDSELRSWFRTVVDVVGDMVERDALTVHDATEYVLAKLNQRAGDRRTKVTVIRRSAD